ncbi:MAG: T9SS C-terminal target domain-containing protein [Ignavibacteriales bacterium]|nr:MAG: T9SS C-terminal target domain-containing protein [Ignavibacteriales bacterium]
MRIIHKLFKLNILLMFLVFPLYNYIYSQQGYWIPAGLEDNAISKISITNSGYIFAATLDSGLFLSKDAGSNWENLFAEPSRTTTLLIADKYFFAGCEWVGLYRSSDFGKTFDYLLQELQWITSIYLTSKNEILIGLHDARTYVGGMIYKSTNLGNTWIMSDTSLSNLSIEEFAENSKGKILAINGGGGLIIDAPPPNTWFFDGGIIESTDNGSTWLRIGLDLIALYALAINKEDEIFVGTHDHGILKSTDDGKTWKEVNDGISTAQVITVTDLIIDSGNNIYAATYDGIYLSTDNGDTWKSWNPDPSVKSIYCLAIDSLGYIYAGTNKGIYKSVGSSTSVLTGREKFTSFELHQNYPNPFNSTTAVKINIPEKDFVEVDVYNPIGEKVSTLVTKFLEKGTYEFIWNSGNEPSGVYFYRLKAGDYSQSRKMILLK